MPASQSGAESIGARSGGGQLGERGRWGGGARRAEGWPATQFVRCSCHEVKRSRRHLTSSYVRDQHGDAAPASGRADRQRAQLGARAAGRVCAAGRAPSFRPARAAGRRADLWSTRLHWSTRADQKKSTSKLLALPTVTKVRTSVHGLHKQSKHAAVYPAVTRRARPALGCVHFTCLQINPTAFSTCFPPHTEIETSERNLECEASSSCQYP